MKDGRLFNAMVQVVGVWGMWGAGASVWALDRGAVQGMVEPAIWGSWRG